MRRGLKILSGLATVAFLLVSCSTTRVLQDNQYRLTKNKIEVSNDEKFDTGTLTPYLQQKPNPSIIFGWNPFLSVYNWSNGNGKAWDKLVRLL